MALTEETLNDKIEVVSQGSWSCVQVRTATVIKRDGDEISRSFHRHVVMPDADLSAEDADVSAICTTVFTQACKDAYAEVTRGVSTMTTWTISTLERELQGDLAGGVVVAHWRATAVDGDFSASPTAL